MIEKASLVVFQGHWLTYIFMMEEAQYLIAHAPGCPGCKDGLPNPPVNYVMNFVMN